MTADPAQRAERNDRLTAALTRARDGDLGALDVIVRELNPLLWHVARSQGVTVAEAADVVQTAWLQLVTRLDSIRTPAALAGWLVTVTKREAWRVGRDHGYASAVELDDFPADELEFDHKLVTDQRDQALWRCFGRLSQRCQALLRVVASADRPDYRQLSEVMGMPVGSIGPTRGRCLTKLREMLLADPGWAT